VSWQVYVVGVVAAAAALWFVAHLAQVGAMRERHAVWWLAGATVALVVALVPGVLQVVASWVGIELVSNLVFFVSIVVLAMIGVQFSVELTGLEERTRVLAEETALQDLRLSDLSARLDAAEAQLHAEASEEGSGAGSGDSSGDGRG
jgi:hypothetical protein